MSHPRFNGDAASPSPASSPNRSETIVWLGGPRPYAIASFISRADEAALGPELSAPHLGEASDAVPNPPCLIGGFGDIFDHPSCLCNSLETYSRLGSLAGKWPASVLLGRPVRTLSSANPLENPAEKGQRRESPAYHNEVHDGALIGSLDNIRLAIKSRVTRHVLPVRRAPSSTSARMDFAAAEDVIADVFGSTGEPSYMRRNELTGFAERVPNSVETVERVALLDAMTGLACELGSRRVIAREKSVGELCPGEYQHLWTIEMGESSYSVGLGLYTGKGSIDQARGMVDINPNKTASSPLFALVHNTVLKACKHAEIVRYDVAVDIPVPRYQVQLMRDRRFYRFLSGSEPPVAIEREDGMIYQLVDGAGITEYLGTTNSPGHVKVYDKQREADLERPLTRIELTVGGLEPEESVERHWPTVLLQTERFTMPGVLPANIDTADLLLLLAAAGVPTEPILAAMDRKKRQRVRRAMRARGPLMAFPTAIFTAIREQALTYARPPAAAKCSRAA